MNARSQVLRFVGAMIFMIAAYAMPSAAYAHGIHQPAAVAAKAAAEPSQPFFFTEAVLSQTAGQTAVISRVASPSERSDKQRCTLGCCSGAPCCAQAFIEQSKPDLPLPCAAEAVLRPLQQFLPGIHPEALPRPPQTFA